MNQTENGGLTYPDNETAQVQTYVTDIDCSGSSSMCITDENKLYLWGKDFSEEKGFQIYEEPTLVCKINDSILNKNDDEESVMALDRVFPLPNSGFLLISKQSKVDYFISLFRIRFTVASVAPSA
jgi:hypothetical protein